MDIIHPLSTGITPLRTKKLAIPNCLWLYFRCVYARGLITPTHLTGGPWHLRPGPHLHLSGIDASIDAT